MLGFGRKKIDQTEQTIVVPVLCRFWQEDGVWNGNAEHLAVAIFGKTFEEAQKNLQAAIVEHIKCWVDAGKEEQLISQLREQAHEHVTVNEIPHNSPVVNISVGLSDHHVVAIA